MNDQQPLLKSGRLRIPGSIGAHRPVPDLYQAIRVLLKVTPALAQNACQDTLQRHNRRFFFILVRHHRQQHRRPLKYFDWEKLRLATFYNGRAWRMSTQAPDPPNDAMMRKGLEIADAFDTRPGRRRLVFP